MDSFRHCLRDRTCDVLDWIDYRRDANFWPFFVLPPVLSATWAYVGTIAFGMIVAFAIGLALVVSGLTLLGMAAWIALRCAGDLLGSLRFRLPILSEGSVTRAQRA